MGHVAFGLLALTGFSVGKSVVIEETFLLASSPKQLEEFIEGSKHAAGSIGFNRGKTLDELLRSVSSHKLIDDEIGRRIGVRGEEEVETLMDEVCE